MTKAKTASPCCEGDDWLIVSCDDDSRTFLASSPQNKRGFDTSQEKNQILHSDHYSEHAMFTNAVIVKNNQQESDIKQMETKNIFQLLVWQSGLDMPIELVDETQKPLLIVTDKKCPLKQLEILVEELILIHTQLRNIFPQVTRENVSDVIQVCERLCEKWVPLNGDAKTEEFHVSEDNKERQESSGSQLEVTSKVDVNRDNWRQLLVESRFTVGAGGNSKDWRVGKFYSDFQENAWRFQLQIDQLIDARDTDDVWYESRILALSSKLVKLHYRGWTSIWDEWIERTSTRIAPLHTKVPNWRDFKLGNAVMVGRHVATKKHPEWRNAIVASEVDNRLQIEVNVDGRTQWMDAQSEMLCPPGTHKASN